MGGACPDENAIQAFVAGAADEDVRVHLHACSRCRMLVALLEDERAGFGRYQVLRTIGRGGMGVVYEAWDPELARSVAIKVLRAHVDDAVLIAREAEAMARVHHPNVARVFDVGIEGEQVFLAMELVDGRTLDAWAEGRSTHEIVRALRDAAEGIEASHRAGIVHRDLKPSNILVDASGRVVVTDFGLAHVSEASPHDTADVVSTRDTKRHTFRGAGTPAFMAPEQHRLEPVDERTDVFGLCGLAYQVLFGVLPFAGCDGKQLLAAKTDGIVAAPIVREHETRLRRTILRGLSARPADRWPTVAALRAALGSSGSRLVPFAIAGGVALGVLALVSMRSDTPPPCAAGDVSKPDASEPDVAELWHERRPELEAAFATTELAYADRAWDRFGTRMDEWIADWSTARANVCDASLAGASRARAEACLDTAGAAASALLDAAAMPDGALVSRIDDAIADLPAAQRCVDAPISDAPLDADAAAIQDELERVRTLELVARNTEAEARVDRLVAAAAEIDAPSLHADALQLRGHLRTIGARPLRGLDDLEAAYLLATKHHDDAVAARAAVDMVTLLGTVLGRVDEAEIWLRHAESASERLGASAALRIRLLRGRAVIHRKRGDLVAALAAATAAHELARETLPEGHGDVGAQQLDVARLLIELGRRDEAHAAIEAGLDLVERSRGSDHPHAAALVQALAGLAFQAGDFDAAIRHYERARVVLTRAFGSSHPQVLALQVNLATIALARGDAAEALRIGAPALATAQEILGPDHEIVEGALKVVGGAQLRLGDADTALLTFTRALELRERDPLALVPLAGALGNVGVALGELGRVDEAKLRFEQSLDAAERAGELGTAAAADAHYNLAGLALARDEPDVAAARAERALALWTRAGAPPQKLTQVRTLLASLSSPPL